MIQDAIGFSKYTEPMQRLLLDAVTTDGQSYVVSSAHPRLSMASRPRTRATSERLDLIIRATRTWPRWARGCNGASP